MTKDPGRLKAVQHLFARSVEKLISKDIKLEKTESEKKVLNEKTLYSTEGLCESWLVEIYGSSEMELMRRARLKQQAREQVREQNRRLARETPHWKWSKLLTAPFKRTTSPAIPAKEF